MAIAFAMRDEFYSLGGKIEFNSKIKLQESQGEVFDSTNVFGFKHLINAAGAQADRISRSVGVGSDYAMVPFMGVYRATSSQNLPLQRLVYPVPHPINPFLGVHFTLTLDGKIKIGPTAIPIGGREQYSFAQGWSGSDITQALLGIKSLISGDSHDFSAILKNEWPKLRQYLLVQEAARIVPASGKISEWQRMPPGIRAQLVHLPTGRLEQDFVVETLANSTHLLNVVSPGWTSCLPFSRHVAEQFVLSEFL
jgi:L-2-hydroxyglutarate oxidase LhgO